MTQYYTDLVPAFPDPETWTFGHVLRHHAAERPDAVCLDLPEEQATWTYAEALDFSERIGSALYAAGRGPGRPRRPDGLQLLALRPHLVGRLARRPRRGADQHQLRGRVPAPPARRRAGPLRRDRRRDGRALGRGGRARPRHREVLGHRLRRRHPRQGRRAAPRARLGGRRVGGARGGGEARAARRTPPGPRRDLLHLRHHRPVQGRGDAALAALLLRPDRGLADPAHARTTSTSRPRRCSTATRRSWRSTR